MLEVSASGSCSIMKCLWVCARKRWIYRCTIPDQTMSIIWLVVLVNCGSFIFWHHMPGLTEKKERNRVLFPSAIPPSISSFLLSLFGCHLCCRFILFPLPTSIGTRTNQQKPTWNVINSCALFLCLCSFLFFFLVLRVYGTPTEKTKVICNHLTIHQWYQVRINYVAVVVVATKTNDAAAILWPLFLPWMPFEHACYAKRYPGSSK